MTGLESELVDRLLEAGSPRTIDDWNLRDGYYVSTCRISSDDIPELIDIMRMWTDENWPHIAIKPDVDDENVEMLPVTAWRALSDLKTEAAIGPLMDILSALDDECDDWSFDELPHVFGKIGEGSLKPLIQFATDRARPKAVRSIAVSGLGRLANYHPDTRDRVVTCLTKMMADATGGDQIDLNSAILEALVELRAVEAAEPIERAFASNFLDVGWLGNWESVRQELGVEGLGLPMPQHPYNCLEQFRRQMGIGIFSERSLFADGDIDDDAVNAYCETAYEAFSQSSEGQQAIERYGAVKWFQSLLHFGIDYLGEPVEELTRDSVDEFVFVYVPRKAATESTEAGAIIGELALFWQFLDRVYKLPAARSIVNWLKTKKLVAQLKSALDDSSNFGMAKSLVMMGKDAGFDITSEAGLSRLMQAYNESLISNLPTQPVTTGDVRVGRNEPCPCGSGKKFKKCCGGRD